MTPRNYLLLLCDDLVPDDLGCRGGKVHTPNIDRIVRKGAVAWFTPDLFPSKNGERHV
jgi:arylsulfatase A-like enzyme